MPTIRIQGTNLEFNESDIITFNEGLIGMPHLHQMVLVRQPEVAPFLWLASLDDADIAFLVVEPDALFGDYTEHVLREARASLGIGEGEQPLVLAISSIAADWTRSTVNLRAPLFINAGTMRGTQSVLVTSTYRLDEPLTQVAASSEFAI